MTLCFQDKMGSFVLADVENAINISEGKWDVLFSDGTNKIIEAQLHSVDL